VIVKADLDTYQSFDDINVAFVVNNYLKSKENSHKFLVNINLSLN
jgi:hypothetical protein